jgi:hypothetical protein
LIRFHPTGTNEEEMTEDLTAMQLRKPIRQLMQAQPLQISSSSPQFYPITTAQSHPNIIPSTSSVSISSSRRKKEPRTKRLRRSYNRDSISETRRETPIILAPKEFSKAPLKEMSKVPKTIHSIPSELFKEASKELPKISSRETSKEIVLNRETPREPPREVVREVVRERPREPPRELSKGITKSLPSQNSIVNRWLEEGTEEDNDSDQ